MNIKGLPLLFAILVAAATLTIQPYSQDPQAVQIQPVSASSVQTSSEGEAASTGSTPIPIGSLSDLQKYSVTPIEVTPSKPGSFQSQTDNQQLENGQKNENKGEEEELVVLPIIGTNLKDYQSKVSPQENQEKEDQEIIEESSVNSNQPESQSENEEQDIENSHEPEQIQPMPISQPIPQKKHPHEPAPQSPEQIPQTNPESSTSIPHEHPHGQPHEPVRQQPQQMQPAEIPDEQKLFSQLQQPQSIQVTIIQTIVTMEFRNDDSVQSPSQQNGHADNQHTDDDEDSEDSQNESENDSENEDDEKEHKDNMHNQDESENDDEDKGEDGDEDENIAALDEQIQDENEDEEDDEVKDESESEDELWIEPVGVEAEGKQIKKENKQEFSVSPVVVAPRQK